MIVAHHEAVAAVQGLLVVASSGLSIDMLWRWARRRPKRPKP